jgi:tyrosyl-tRNA synthetase
MLTFDSVKTRLDREQPLSFLEFNYMILQAYDFVELNRKFQCQLQIGGSDQWGNIVNGVELSRRLNAQHNNNDSASDVFGLTTPLLTTADNKKMGKSAQGAIWLDDKLLSPFDYFQYFRNTHDDDVIKFLKLFTDLDLNKIASFEKLSGQDLNQAKEVLAFETTKICHSLDTAQQVLQQAKEIFLNKNSQAFIEKIIESQSHEIKLSEILLDIKACESKSEGKRLIEGNAIKINNQLITDINLSLNTNSEFELTIGKKKFFKIKLIKT